MNIFLIPNTNSQDSLAKKILSSHHCNNLFIQSNHPFNNNTIGTNVSINVNAFDEVEAFCIANKIDCLVINNIELLNAGLFNFINEETRTWKGIVTGCSNAFFDEPFAATEITSSKFTLVSDGKKYFNITKNDLGETAIYIDRLMQNLSENNYAFNGCMEVFVSENNSMKYYPCLFNETAVQELETDLVSIFAAAYNGTFEDVNIEFV